MYKSLEQFSQLHKLRFQDLQELILFLQSNLIDQSLVKHDAIKYKSSNDLFKVSFDAIDLFIEPHKLYLCLNQHTVELPKSINFIINNLNSLCLFDLLKQLHKNDIDKISQVALSYNYALFIDLLRQKLIENNLINIIDFAVEHDNYISLQSSLIDFYIRIYNSSQNHDKVSLVIKSCETYNSIVLNSTNPIIHRHEFYPNHLIDTCLLLSHDLIHSKQ